MTQCHLPLLRYYVNTELIQVTEQTNNSFFKSNCSTAVLTSRFIKYQSIFAKNKISSDVFFVDKWSSLLSDL